MNPIQIDPAVMNGTPCFAGTRVPVKTFFDYLAHGQPLDEFLRQFPTVTREQAVDLTDLLPLLPGLRSALDGLPAKAAA